MKFKRGDIIYDTTMEAIEHNPYQIMKIGTNSVIIKDKFGVTYEESLETIDRDFIPEELLGTPLLKALKEIE